VKIYTGPILQFVSNPVDPDNFLTACDQYVPEATLSVGWTTSKFGKVSYTIMEIFWWIIYEFNDTSYVSTVFKLHLSSL
jgi:hypothetical protein